MSETLLENPAINSEAVINSIQQVENWYLPQPKDTEAFINNAIAIYSEMETAAQDWQRFLPQTKQDAEKLKALWVISAPGTYFKARKQDRYSDKPWAMWNDRRRINHAFGIARRVTELVSGEQLTGNWGREKELILEHGPLAVYNGTPLENADLAQAVATPWLRIPRSLAYPKEKVCIINPFDRIDNVVDQVKSFRLPEDFKISEGDEIGIVIHAPQAPRLLHTLNKFSRVFPTGVRARIFPLPNPDRSEYPRQELRGLVYYRFIADPPLASGLPYPYKV